VNLEELNCSNNELTDLNLSKNTKLVKLDCSNNKLTEIPSIENCIELDEENFNFEGNELEKVDVKDFFSKKLNAGK